MRGRKWAFVALSLAMALAVARAAPPGDDAASDEKLAFSRLLADYAAAFNKHDAKQVAAFWGEKAVYTDSETGEKSIGRAAIQADFEELFKKSPNAHLTLRSDDVRLVKPDVALLDGTAALTTPPEPPEETSFAAVLVKQDGHWLLDSVRESAKPTPASAAAALDELGWLVGNWVDRSEGVDVQTTVAWAAEKSFLVRTYKVKAKDGDEMTGTQVIGWDAKRKRVRSWNFDSDGSFGEGEWAKNGDEWLIKSSQTLADGRAASATEIITRTNNDALTVRRVGHEIDGEPQPASEPVKVERVAAQPASDKK